MPRQNQRWQSTWPWPFLWLHMQKEVSVLGDGSSTGSLHGWKWKLGWLAHNKENQSRELEMKGGKKVGGSKEEDWGLSQCWEGYLLNATLRLIWKKSQGGWGVNAYFWKTLSMQRDHNPLQDICPGGLTTNRLVSFGSLAWPVIHRSSSPEVCKGPSVTR